MAAPRSTIWPAEPHTLAKHEILRLYLGAWFPILASRNRRLIYYDGFAGPGRYAGGEEGSPVIALKTALNHKAPLDSELVFVFVEEDQARARHLGEVEIPALNLPVRYKVNVRNERFEGALGKTLDDLDKAELRIAPTFAFVDPFGISGLPFSLIKRLIARESCEVLITFMGSAIERFVTELTPHVNELIGNADAANMIAGAPDRVACARALYATSLRSAARFVRFFQMRDQNNRPIYDLFFATNHHLGHEKMKDAMWKVDGRGGFTFSDGLDPNQLTLFSPTPEVDLAPVLWRQFRGQQVDADDVLTYTRDETAYRCAHARSALLLLEDDHSLDCGRVTVAVMKRDGKKRRPRSFPPGTIIQFAP